MPADMPYKNVCNFLIKQATELILISKDSQWYCDSFEIWTNSVACILSPLRPFPWGMLASNDYFFHLDTLKTLMVPDQVFFANYFSFFQIKSLKYCCVMTAIDSIVIFYCYRIIIVSLRMGTNVLKNYKRKILN